MVYHKEIIWDESTKDNITTRFGKIEGNLIFTMCRFKTTTFPDENWVVTSEVIPMDMKKGKDLRRLEADLNLELDTFLLKILDI